MFPSSTQAYGFVACSAALLLALCTQTARAQSNPDAGVAAIPEQKQEQHAVAPPKAAPPTLLYAPEPPFPKAASAAGLTQGTVTLRVLIDTSGQVTEAEVVEPAGYDFDELAMQAAREHRFDPARREGEPIAARVLLRVAFHLPPPAAEAPAPEVSAPEVSAPEAPAAEAPAAQPATALSPAEPAAPEPGTKSAPASPGVDVTVRGRSQAERLRRSAEAVHVVDTTEAKRRAADLGEVLARTQGVGVQRAGGIGSDTRFSLNGLTDDQIRFFLDDIPLDFAGYPFGVANIPINLVERVEIYRGVVPIRFGADALGGAVNIVSDRSLRGTHAATSLQAGSFGTYLLTLSAQHLHAPSGWFNRVSGFLDRADNNYPMNVEVADAEGNESIARVYRFHDGYRAQGANVETGVVDKRWAKRLLLRGFVTQYDKEIQHNLLMTYRYGDITLSELTAGATLRYEHNLGERVSVDAVAGYSVGLLHYEDLGKCVYDWFGQCVRERPQRGERNGRPEDQYYDEHNAYLRINLDYRLHPQHLLRLSIAPTYTGRTGDERRQANKRARDPLSAERNLVSMVSGLEYKVDLADNRIENVAFVKDYLQLLHSEDPLANGGEFQRRDSETHRFGIGDSLRYTFADWIYAKASYEWATRLPRPDEIFGNAFPIQANLELQPELSHNINLGLTLSAPLGAAGSLRTDINGFMRNADQLIVLVGNDKTAMYQNVFSARSLGAELAAGYTSPGDYFALDGNFTYVDFRNTSDAGAFEDYKGARIPNRPYVFANGNARLQLSQLAAARDVLALTWVTRYVHAFYRGWETMGSHKLSVPSQLVHSIALTYLVRGDLSALSFSCEVQNITDQAAFDFFGVPRPGRAFYFKATASL